MDDAKPPESTQRPSIYQLFMLGLCIYVLGVLAVQAVTPMEDGTKAILEYADLGICAIFFADFVGNLIFARDRLAYLKWGWIDLLSSIPMIEPLRVGRIARIARILRVLRGVRSARILASFILARRAQGAFAAVSLIALLLIVFASIAILHVETSENSNIRSPEDALWWSIATITTVGYGDKYPVTSEGRAIAAMVMIAGVAIIGTFSGFVASWFLSPGEEDASLAAIRGEIRELRQLLASKEEPPGASR
jgi:voltage-gated potassium channel